MKRWLLIFPLVLLGGGCLNDAASTSADALQEELTVMQEMMEEMLDEMEENQAEEMNDEDVTVVEEVEADDALYEDQEGSGQVDDTTGEATEEPVEELLEPVVLQMTSGNFFFTPSVIEVQPGQEVTIGITENKGIHTFVIDEIGYKKSLESGTVLSFTAPTVPGSYSYYCDIGSHRALGMEGTLIVK